MTEKRARALPRRVHFVGICGRAMGAVAIALAGRGVRVSGSDLDPFPPMSARLAAAGIAVAPHFDARHVPDRLDHAVVGAIAAADNPELQAIRARGISWSSLPRFLGTHLLARSRNLVVAGTNGKTTTTAMLTQILRHAGRDPDHLIGGRPRGAVDGARFAGSDWAVIEGDEYVSGPDDPRPKFLHYRPWLVALTDVRHDHVEVFPDPAAYRDLFARLVAAVPSDGAVLVDGDDPATRRIARRARAAVIATGFGAHADVPIERPREGPRGVRFRLRGVPFRLGMIGRMNIVDAALAALAAERAGVPLPVAAAALATFAGVEGRLDPLLAGRLHLFGDEGYHPRALERTILALRAAHPRRRIVVALQPRYTGGAAGPQQKALPAALAGADRVVLADAMDLPPGPVPPFDPQRLVRALRRRGVDAVHAGAVAALPQVLRTTARRGDVVLLSLAMRNDAAVAAIVASLRPLA